MSLVGIRLSEISQLQKTNIADEVFKRSQLDRNGK
jgi:hypothetical protein